MNSNRTASFAYAPRPSKAKPGNPRLAKAVLFHSPFHFAASAAATGLTPRDLPAFPSPAGYLWNPDNFGHYFGDVNTRAGLPWTCLDFRNTFGSLLAQQGVSLYSYLGNDGKQPTICQRHYASLDSKALNRAIRQFPSKIFREIQDRSDAFLKHGNFTSSFSNNSTTAATSNPFLFLMPAFRFKSPRDCLRFFVYFCTCISRHGIHNRVPPHHEAFIPHIYPEMDFHPYVRQDQKAHVIVCFSFSRSSPASPSNTMKHGICSSFAIVDGLFIEVFPLQLIKWQPGSTKMPPYARDIKPCREKRATSSGPSTNT